MYALKFKERLPSVVKVEFEGLIAWLKKFDTTSGDLADHTSDFDNPHHVTATQIGAPNNAVFQSHHLRHEEGGADEIVATDLLGVDVGRYTPTLTGVANVAASTAYSCHYIRIGTQVTVSGRVDVDPTGAGNTQLGISLPIASNFGAAADCAGAAAASGIAGQSAAIRGDATNDRAELVWVAVDFTNQAMYFTFQYEII